MADFSFKSPEKIPVDRIIRKLDGHLSRNDYQGAEQHLNYWVGEAKQLNDSRGLVTLYNELLGLYRKTGKEDRALQCISDALSCVDTLGLSDSVSGATVLLNCATVYTAFHMAAKGLPLFEKAKEIYERELDPSDERLAGLYNNMAIACSAEDNFREAVSLYEKALSVLAAHPHSKPEQAITMLNLADAAESAYGAEDSAERIEEYLARAQELLNAQDVPHDGHYAFVCEKCAPVFDYYGFFAFAKELSGRAKEIYERS